MSQTSSENDSSKQSPMIWFIIIIIAMVMVLVFFSGRSGTTTEEISLGANQNTPKFAGDIDRPSTLAAGLEARELIRQAREKKRPYPLEKLHAVALERQQENNMADAHLLFFFCAREGYLPSILKMGEMSDPLTFNEQNSLLDQADSIQAYKWYRIAIERENSEAQKKMNLLHEWAKSQADRGNVSAQQLLLNFIN